MASFRVKQGVWSNPPASAFLQVKSYMYSILLPFLPHGTRPRGLNWLPGSTLCHACPTPLWEDSLTWPA